jgi:2-dehydro-3-deoxyglucarate aldolase/4-hydroxy-2-oxoheptanedioate aldolase
MAAAGFDFVWVDGEHGPFDQQGIERLVRAIAAAGATPIVRVGEFSYTLVARALDAGAQGIILPRANDVAKLRDALSWTRFPPDGIRGYGLGGPHLEYEKASLPDVIAHRNAHTMVIVQFENSWAIDHADELLQLPFVDVALIGPADLSISLGVPGEFDHPTMVAEIDRLIAACQRHGVAPGIHMRAAAAAKKWLERGMRFVSAGSEHIFLLEKATETVAALSPQG